MIFPKEAKDKIEALPRYRYRYSSFSEEVAQSPNGEYVFREEVMKILREMKA